MGELLKKQGAKFEYGTARLEDRAAILADFERVGAVRSLGNCKGCFCFTTRGLAPAAAVCCCFIACPRKSWPSPGDSCTSIPNPAPQVKPTHVLNAAGVTGRPNVDWCAGVGQGAVCAGAHVCTWAFRCSARRRPSVANYTRYGALTSCQHPHGLAPFIALQVRDPQGGDHPRQRDWLPQPGRRVPAERHPHDLLRHRCGTWAATVGQPGCRAEPCLELSQQHIPTCSAHCQLPPPDLPSLAGCIFHYDDGKFKQGNGVGFQVRGSGVASGC